MSLRIVVSSDAEAIANIYRPIVNETATSFETEAPSTAEMATRIDATVTHHPWLVWEQDGEVSAYAYANPHRSRRAYRWSCDVSVYVSEQARKQGLGRTLYTHLFGILKQQGFANAYAGITLPNAASVGLHESMGFSPVGIYQNVGFKAGAWHDVGWWHLTLQELDDNPPDPEAFSTIR